MTRFATTLLVTASTLAFAVPAMAASTTLYASDAQLARSANEGQRVTQLAGITQIRLEGGGTASFVAGASFQIRADGSIDLFSGTVTVASGDGAPVVIHLADRGEGRVAGKGSAASFSVDSGKDGSNEAKGHVLTGTVTIVIGTGSPRQFTAGQMWNADGARAQLAVANGAAAVPEAGETIVEPMGGEGGAVAAAANGIPVVLGDALAAAGASGDVVAAARRVQAASANPSLESYPSGDLALLVAYAGNLNGAYGGRPFNGAAADIIRTYLQFLCTGGAQTNFLSAYAGFMVQYLDLIRTGALPSSFRGTNLAQINSFISFRGRTSGFGTLSGQNRVLVDAYLAFILGGGNADQFLVRYTDLTAAYFTFIRGGGSPAAFTGASQSTITAYLTFLRDAGLLANLSAQNQALLSAYLNSLSAGGNGLAFADTARVNLNLYYIYLQQGRLPSGYTAADLAALRQYLETLKATGLFDQTLGAQAGFFNGYLVWLQGGGAVDGYAQLPVNIFAGYASALSAYYEFLNNGGTPSGYTVLTQAQITAYLTALENAGATARFTGNLGTFWSQYFAWISGGNNPNLFAGLPVPPDYPAFATALNAYYVYLAGGGLPGSYSALTLEQLRTYINALIAAGRLGDLGGNASFLSAYFTYLGNGGVPNGYAQLPVYVNYQSALNAYYAYLQGGGLPSAYTALTPAQLQAYLQALINAGVYGSLFTGDTATFLTAYYNFVAGGGAPNAYTGLAAYTSYVSALNAYFVYLQGGGLPGSYTALTLAQLQAYLQALIDAGILGQYFTGGTLTFFQGYYTFVSGGGTANNYTGLATIVTGGGSGGTGGTGNYAGGFPSGSAVTMFAVTGSNGGGGFTGGTVTVNTDGTLANSTHFTPLTAQSTDAAGDSRGIVGRFTNGTVQWNGITTLTYGPNAGMSYVVMAPIVGTLPTSGTVSYSVMGATRPVYDDGHTAPGAFAANLMIGLSNLHYAINGTITMPDATYTVTAGNIATSTLVAPQSTSPTFYGIRPGISAGPACPSGGCQINMFGSFGGSNPQERLGLAYHTMSSPTGKTITGSVLFGQNGTFTGGGSGGTGGGTTSTVLTGYSGGFTHTGPKLNMIVGATLVATDIGYVTNTYTLNSSGGLTSMARTGGVSRGIGSAQVTDIYGNAQALIGRWTNGSTTGNDAYALTANQGFHYLLAQPVASNFALPTSGTINYSLIAATKPTMQNGFSEPGTFSGSMALAFGTQTKVGMEASILMPNQGNPITYTFSTTGGVANPLQSTINLNLYAQSGPLQNFIFTVPGTLSNNGCVGSCSINVQGMFAGDQNTIGITYAATRNVGGTAVVGSAIFAASGSGSGSGGSGTAPTAPTGDGTNWLGVGGIIKTTVTTPTQFSDFVQQGLTENSGPASGVVSAADGSIQSVTLSTGSQIVRGTAAVVQNGTAGGNIGWTRWAGGTASTSIPSATGNIPTNGGYALASAKTVTNMPTSGTATYTVTGSTAPFRYDGTVAPGTLNSASLAVNFATQMAGLELSATVSGTNYSMQSFGGVANPTMAISTSAGSLGYFQGNLDSKPSTPSASGTAHGFLAGPGAANAIASYQFNSGSNVGATIGGVIGFTKP